MTKGKKKKEKKKKKRKKKKEGKIEMKKSNGGISKTWQ